MKNKQLLIGASVLSLLCVFAYFAWNKGTQTSTISSLETSFAVRDTASINKIFISTKSGQRATLRRREDRRWVINDSILVAPSKIDNLLDIIRGMELKRPLARAERNTVIKDIAAKHYKVEIYLKDELFKTYYVGGEPQDQIGSYFLLDGFEMPYVMYLPGHQGFLSINFNVEANAWRDLALFSSTPRSLQKVTVKYLSKPNQSFAIKYANNSFGLEGATQPIDSTKLFSYLSNYQHIFVEQYIQDATKHERDSLSALHFDVEISVEDINKEKTKTIKMLIGNMESERFIGIVAPNNELVTVQRQAIRDLFVGKSNFYKAK